MRICVGLFSNAILSRTDGTRLFNIAPRKDNTAGVLSIKGSRDAQNIERNEMDDSTVLLVYRTLS